MSVFFGTKTKAVKPEYTGYQTQTSSSVQVVPLTWGETRIAPNVIWYGDFQAHKHTQGGGGKLGGGSGSVTYTYSASLILGLTVGEIHDVTKTYKDQSTVTGYASLGFTLFTGSMTQAPWGFLSANHPTEALAYPGLAYLAVPNYDLGNSNQLSNHNFIVQALRWGTAPNGIDADCALTTEDFLGYIPFPSPYIDTVSLLSGPDAPTTGDNAYQTYCTAMGFGFSPNLVNQETGGDILDRWMKLTNTALVWTGYSLKFIPFAEKSITANGVTYLPAFDPVYTLGDGSYIFKDGEEPIAMSRADPADAYNMVSLQFKDRANDYNDAPVQWIDPGLISQFGPRPDSSIQADEIHVADMASKIVTLYGQRQAYLRNEYTFMLSARYCRIEPMDVLTCWDPKWGYFNVIIQDVEEDEDNNLSVTAKEFTGSVGQAPGFGTQAKSGTTQNTLSPPGPVNVPILLEPPSSLTGGTPQVWAVVSGGNGTIYNPYWGGCFVWIALDDGFGSPGTFNEVGQIDAPARQGLTTTSLPAYGGANPDTGHTVTVNLSESGGSLMSGSSTDAANYVTLCFIEDAGGGNGEYLAYQDATLTTSFTYQLGTALYRGLYGTTASLHAIGSKFARLDDSVFKFDLPAQYIGQTIHLKFQSYNIWGKATEDLSTCVDYTYDPTGAGFGGGTGGVPTTPTGLTAVVNASGVAVTWNANPSTDNVQTYKLYRAAGTGASFGSASLIATLNALSYVDVGASGSTGYTYFLVAHNVIGDSTPTAGVNASSAAAVGALWGWGFERDIAALVLTDPVSDFTSKPSWLLPQNLPLCSVKIVGTAPTAQTDFDLQVAGVSVGTIRFAASSLVATFIKASNTTVPADTIVQVWPPSNLNGMTGKLFGSIAGPRL